MILRSMTQVADVVVFVGAQTKIAIPIHRRCQTVHLHERVVTVWQRLVYDGIALIV